jgi:hypothetical protein
MKIRWTDKLQDYMDEVSYCIELSDAGYFSKIREAELVHGDAAAAPPDVASNESQPSARKRKAEAEATDVPADTKKAPPLSVARSSSFEQAAVFEDPPTFAQFNQCFESHDIKSFLKFTITSVLPKYDFCVADTSFDQMVQKKQRFSVLWLTEDTFISSIRFWTRHGHSALADYQIVLVPRESNKATLLYVYSLSSMRRGLQNRHSPPSLAPISFLASMCNQLPSNYFRSIHFSWFRSGVPRPLVKLLSIFPSSRLDIQEPMEYNDVTKVLFTNQAWSRYFYHERPKDIRAVLSYCARSNLPVRHVLQLELSTAVNAALRESPHLRHMHIPTDLSWDRVAEEEVPFTANDHIESITGIFGCNGTSVSRTLKGIADNRGLKRVYAEVREGLQLRNALLYLLRAIFSGSSPLQEMIVVFITKCGYDTFDSVSKIVEGYFDSRRCDLRHFSVVRSDSKTTQDWPVPSFHEAMVNSDSWDRLISPHLALNWFDNHRLNTLRSEKRTPQSLGSASVKSTVREDEQLKLVPWKVRAVNLGIVYRKTTYHVPNDTSTTNASLLFAVLATDVVAQLLM